MNYIFVILAMLGFLVCGSAAMFVLARAPRDTLNRLFFGFASAVAFYNVFTFIMIINNTPSGAEVSQKYSVILWLLFILVLFQFCLFLSRIFSARAQALILAPLFALGLITAVIGWFTNWFYLTPERTVFGFAPRQGPYFIPFAAYSTLLVVASIVLTWVHWKRSESTRERNQSLTILIGLAVAALFGFMGDVVFPLFGEQILSLVPLASNIFVLVFAYAMIRYGFLVVTPSIIAQDILKTMPDFFVFAGTERAVLMVNQGLLKALGYSMNEVINKPCENLYADKGQYQRVHDIVEKSGAVKAQKMVLAKKDRELISVMMEAVCVKDRFAEDLGCIFIFRDITREEQLVAEQKEAIAELTRTKERMLSILEDTTQAKNEAKETSADLARALDDLKVVDKMKTEFLSVISHELRTPITPILGYVSMFVEQRFGKLEPMYLKGADIIKKEAQHLIGLIDSILDVTRMERGRALELLREPFSLKSAVKELLEVTQPQLEGRDIAIKVDLPDDFPTILADSAKLRRLLANLLGNAIKFTPKGGEITITGLKQADRVEVRVSDSGIGVPEEALNKIFDRFFQVDSSYTRAAGGVGLGLAIAKEIVETHGGRIWAESKGIGKGLSICFTLPIT